MFKVIMGFKDKDGFYTAKRVNLPVKNFEKSFTERFKNAKKNNVKVVHFSYKSPFTLSTALPVDQLNQIARSFSEEGISNLEDLYAEVFANTDRAWIANAEGVGLVNVIPFDDEETLNQVLANKTPWEILHSIDDHFNYGDDYLYFTGANQLSTMNKIEFNAMLKKKANLLLGEYLKQHDIKFEVVDSYISLV